MANPSAALTSLINDFVARVQALIDADSSPGVEKAMAELAHGLFGSGSAKVAAPKRGRGRPRGSKKVAAPKTAAKKGTPGDEAMCRYPGCPNKHSGPRYHKFCREHFASLTAAEREKFKSQWKAAHGG